MSLHSQTMPTAGRPDRNRREPLLRSRRCDIGHGHRREDGHRAIDTAVTSSISLCRLASGRLDPTLTSDCRGPPRLGEAHTMDASSGEASRRIGTLGEAVAPEVGRRQKMQIVVAVLLGLFLGALDQTIVGPALPTVVTQLSGGDYHVWGLNGLPADEHQRGDIQHIERSGERNPTFRTGVTSGVPWRPIASGLDGCAEHARST